MLTKREEKIVKLIKNGTLRRRRVLGIICLFAGFMAMLVVFEGKSDEGIAQIQNSCSAVILNLSKIKTSTSLELELKNALMQQVRVLQQITVVYLFAVIQLILIVFLAILVSLCSNLIVSGCRDNIIKKLSDSSEHASDSNAK